jgi:putative endonuclease
VAGLVPATHACIACESLPRQHRPMQGGWVYIVTNRPNGILYVGVTSDLARRAWEHREGVVAGFTKRYGLKRLVFAERHDDIRTAIQREKNMKHWPRAWKIRLILATNPAWDNFYDRLS